MNQQLKRNSFVAVTAVMTLEDVKISIMASDAISSWKRRELSSAINSVALWLHRTPIEVPAAYGYLDRVFGRFNFGTLGVSRARFRNVRSLMKQALRAAGVRAMSQSKPELSSEWANLRDRIEDPYAKGCLRRFFNFCSALKIAPELVDDDVVERFLQVLTDENLASRPLVSVQSAVRLWNRMVERVPGWPETRLKPLLRRETYTVSWSEVHPELASEIELYLAVLAGADPLHPLAPRRPLRPLTIRKRRYELLQLISGMRHQGVSIENFRRLADLCDPALIKRSLNFFIQRHRKRHGENSDPGTSAMIFGIADAVRILAKHYAGAPESVVSELTRIANRLNRRSKGMTEKNRLRLAQLDPSQVQRKFLSYPRAEMQKLTHKKVITRRDSVRYSVLLGMEILIVAPMRTENLAELDLQKNFCWPPNRKAEIGIVIRRDHVKNDVPLEYKIPRGSVAAFWIYLNRFRPLLYAVGSDALFPSRGGRSKRTDTLSKQITALIQNELGIAWNPHIFRHFAVRLYLRAHPGDYEGARRLLAHLNAETTFRTYEGMNMRPAVDRYDELLESMRGQTPTASKKRQPSRASHEQIEE